MKESNLFGNNSNIDKDKLLEIFDITNKEQLLNVFREFVPIKLLGERQIKFIKYLWEDLGYDWK